MLSHMTVCIGHVTGQWSEGCGATRGDVGAGMGGVCNTSSQCQVTHIKLPAGKIVSMSLGVVYSTEMLGQVVEDIVVAAGLEASQSARVLLARDNRCAGGH